MYMGPYTIWSIPLISDFIKITNPWLYIPFYLFIYAAACFISMYVYYGFEKLISLIAKKITKNKQKKLAKSEDTKENKLVE